MHSLLDMLYTAYFVVIDNEISTVSSMADVFLTRVTYWIIQVLSNILIYNNSDLLVSPGYLFVRQYNYIFASYAISQQ